MKYTGNAKSDPNSVVPKDDYFLRCTGVQHTDKDGNELRSKKSGLDMWVLEMSIDEGPHKNRKLWHYLVFIPAGKPGHGMALKCLKAFGIDPEGENEIMPEMLYDVVVKAQVGIQESEGYEPKNQVTKWYVPGELSKPGSTDFDPAKLEKESTEVPPTTAEPQPAQQQAAAPARKPLWGARK